MPVDGRLGVDERLLPRRAVPLARVLELVDPSADGSQAIPVRLEGGGGGHVSTVAPAAAGDHLVELAAIAEQLGPDERRVLVAIARRLALGARAYGPLDIAGDRRDWMREAAEEACDQAVYLACAVLREEGQR